LRKNLTIAAALSGALLLASGASAPALADDVMVWRPTTAAGGAPVNPDFWNNQAAVRWSGGRGVQSNVSITPTVSSSVYYDYSTPVTNQDIEGGQTNVSAQGNLANGGNFTVSTQRGDTVFSDNAQQNNTDTNASSMATMGDGASVSTSASNTANGGN